MKTNSQKYSIKIAWLYPELMNTYGDRGNIIVLQKRCEWRDVDVVIENISIDSDLALLETCDLIFMGGAQDTQQEIVNDDLFTKKGKLLKEKIENNTPGLFICGAYQFLGKYYKTADDKRLTGLGIFPCFTENPGDNTPRLIGNVTATIANSQFNLTNLSLVGFENHGGRTYLEDQSQAFAHIQKGFGNNGKDLTEGIMYKNAIGSYLHGPILPKNPELADWLIQKAIELKYDVRITLNALEDKLENKAKMRALNPER